MSLSTLSLKDTVLKGSNSFYNDTSLQILELLGTDKIDESQLISTTNLVYLSVDATEIKKLERQQKLQYLKAPMLNKEEVEILE